MMVEGVHALRQEMEGDEHNDEVVRCVFGVARWVVAVQWCHGGEVLLLTPG